VLVTLSGRQDGEDVTARTDAAGVARFPGIAGGAYSPMVSVPKGWYLDAIPPIRIRAGNNTALLRATLNDLSTLSASASFDRASYVPGDTVQERVTLTNSGAADITGLVAHCGEWPADTNVLTSNGWGDLAPDGAGVTVRAGETRTWVFTDVVPPQAVTYGFVLLWCNFSPARGSDGPAVEALASVPGGHGTATGTVVDEAEKPLAGIRFLMVDKVSGVVAAQGVSDGTGFLQFSDLPAGLYDLRPTGPWRVDGTDFVIQVRAEEVIDYTPIVLMPGPVQGEPPVLKSTVDTPPVPAPVPAPAPQASPRPANLAYTGVDVAPLIALGFLLVVAGALALRVRRRNCV
jgi:hypothetical protein